MQKTSDIIRQMKKLSRHILLWILIMAIPLQGLAAASMMLCATEHHQVSAVQIQQISPHQHEQQVDVHQHTSDATAHKHAAKDKCSSCAACCVGAALLSSYVDSPVSRPASEKIDMVFSSHVGHISDGLERPHRA